MSKINIAVAHHKKFFTFSNDIFQPIHVGKELSNENLNIQQDNQGENISNLNPFYCEMTAMYWMWKNLDSDFYGLNHYRRYFINKNRILPTFNSIKYFIKKKVYKNKQTIFWDNYVNNNSQSISNLLNKTTNSIKSDIIDYKMIIPHRCELLNMNVKNFFTKELNGRHIESLEKIIFEDYENFYPFFLKSLSENYLYPANIFLFDKEIFNNYCEIIFEILKKHYDAEITIKGDLNEYSRISGYMSELITNAFIQMKIFENVKYKKYNVLYID